MTEQWRPIPGFEGLYDVSNLGRLRGWSDHRGMPGPHIVTSKPGKNGYTNVTLYVQGRRFYRSMHALVALAFHGPRPEGLQVRHLDGQRSNNVPENLAYGTASENQLDKQRHGTDHRACRDRCDYGHEYTPENTAISGRGHRSCRKCNARRQAETRERRRLGLGKYAATT